MSNIGTPVSLGTASNTGNGSTSLAITLGTAILVGDLVVVAFANASNGAVSVSGVSDGTNTYSLAKAQNDGASGHDVELWYKENAAAVASGSITITYNASGGAGSVRVGAAARIANVKLSSSLDTTAAQAATATATPTVTSAVLAEATEIAIGVAYQEAANSYSESSGFTNTASKVQGTETIKLSYDLVAATTAVTFAPTWGGSATCVTLLCSFKALHAFVLTPTTATYSVAGVATTLKRALHLIPTTATYVVSGVSTLLTKGYHFSVSAASYSVSAVTIVLARLVGDASKTALRRAQFVLQKLRTNDPTLGD